MAPQPSTAPQPSASSFFTLLRLALGISGERPVAMDEAAWRAVHAMARKQSLLGVMYHAVELMPQEQRPPRALLMQWFAERENIGRLNTLMNAEAVRLTRLFSEQGRRTAILKGQANARLYPDPSARQPGDIDIWVEGGHDSVVRLLEDMGLTHGNMVDTVVHDDDEATSSYHHVHLPANAQGIVVEVHFRPSSGCSAPLANRRLQRYLELTAPAAMLCPEGFFVPPMPFALIMQLAHIQRHFFGGGVGLRQLVDYYMLLRHSTADERAEASALLRHMGLRRMGQAMMWLLADVLHLDEGLMLCPPDERRGRWLLAEAMEGGNFGTGSDRLRHGEAHRILKNNQRHLRLMGFSRSEGFWHYSAYCWHILTTLPERIRTRSASLHDARAINQKMKQRQAGA